MQHSSMHLVGSSGVPHTPSEQRRVAVVGGPGDRRLIEPLADRPGGGLSVDVLVSDPRDLGRDVGGPHARVRHIMVPDLGSVSRGDLIARYDAVVYALDTFRERPLSAPGAALYGSVCAGDISNDPGPVPDWIHAIVVGSGERACAAVRTLSCTPAEPGVRREIVVLGGAGRRQRTLIDALPTQMDGVSVTVCGTDRLAAVRGQTCVESVLTCGSDGATRLRSAHVVVNATGELPAVLAGLPVTSTGHICNEAGQIRGTAHEFVLGSLQHGGSDATTTAVAPGNLAEHIGEHIGDCRGPWSAVDPLEWLEFRHGAEPAADPIQAVLAS
jgi:hypothetical protein